MNASVNRPIGALTDERFQALVADSCAQHGCFQRDCENTPSVHAL
jgi:hypothetical protein